jgi:hypothetical protein
MTEHDHGPLRSYQVTWRSGLIEVVQGQQVTFDSLGFLSAPAPWFRIHGQSGTHWRLVLAGPEEDITSIRDVTGRG